MVFGEFHAQNDATFSFVGSSNDGDCAVKISSLLRSSSCYHWDSPYCLDLSHIPSNVTEKPFLVCLYVIGRDKEDFADGGIVHLI